MNTICSTPEHKDRLKLGNNIVIHPFVSIDPLNGPIVIEDGVIIEEKSQIINNKSTPLVIGSHSYIQVGSTIIDSNIGKNCILQPRSLLKSVNLGDHCVIGAKTSIYTENIPSKTLIINGSRIQKPVFEDSSHDKRLEYLHGILPKCHETFEIGSTECFGALNTLKK